MSQNSQHPKGDAALRGPDKQQADLVDQRDDPTQTLPEGLRRERKGPVNRTTGRGNETPPPHVPQAGPVGK